MALLMKAGGQVETVTPKNGKCFTLSELQGYVGGYIEPLRLRDGTIMWLNEDGKAKELPYNSSADFIAALESGMSWGDYIVGDAVIASLEESGEGRATEDDELLP